MPSLGPSFDPAAVRPSESGAWMLAAIGPVRVSRYEVDQDVVLVPTEDVLLLTADLPLPSARRRAEALPYAIEDLIAVPLSSVHVALGEEIAPGRHLAGVVAHAVIERWIAELSGAGLDRARLVPDALALPIPPSGSWTVDLSNDRALVRTDEGTGFAVPANHLPAIWTAAGRPSCIALGEPLSALIPTIPAPSGVSVQAAPSLDLRQSVYARPRRRLPRTARRALFVAAGGLLAHGVIALADTAALGRTAAVREQETRARLVQAMPGVPVDQDLAVATADLMTPTAGRSSVLLPLLGRVATALAPSGGSATLRSLAYDGAGSTLKIEVEAADMDGLQRVGRTLQASGLVTESGAASASQGKAVGAFVVRSPR